jgi:hypothetical protein
MGQVDAISSATAASGWRCKPEVPGRRTIELGSLGHIKSRVWAFSM